MRGDGRVGDAPMLPFVAIPILTTSVLSTFLASHRLKACLVSRQKQRCVTTKVKRAPAYIYAQRRVAF